MPAGVRRRSDVSDDERDEESSPRTGARASAGASGGGSGSTAEGARASGPADALVQRRWGWHVVCEIRDDHVVYEQARFLSRSATRVPFESIPDDPVREMRIDTAWPWAVAVLFAGLLWCLQPLAAPDGVVDPMGLLALASGLAGSVFMLRHQSGYFIVYPCEGKQLEFFDRDEDPALREFLERLQERKTRYLGETYGPRSGESGQAFDTLSDASDDPGGYRH